MEQCVDWRGVPIEVGAIVVFPSRQGSNVWMNERIVVSVELNNNIGPFNRDKWFVGVQPIEGGRVAYPKPDRITVVGRPA